MKFDDGKSVSFYDTDSGLGISKNGRTVEEYESQNDFLRAYKLD